MLTLHVHTTPRVSLTIILKVTRSFSTWTGQGHHRRRQTHIRVLYQLAIRGQAGPKGLSMVRLRVGYHTTRQVTAALLVTAQAAKIHVTRTMQVTILPPQTPRRKPGTTTRHKH